jgi:hypothetical protein
MRFGAHQTFHVRDSWLLKGMDAVNEDSQIFRNENAVEELGVGKNMVDSIEYWLRAANLIIKEENNYYLSHIATTIYENDSYLELDGSNILLHYLLACNEEEATTFYWFFNKFGATEFDTESLHVYLQSYVQSQDKKINPNTLKKDINCLVRTYKEPEYKDKVNPESENPSPFVKFGLITEENKKLTKNKFKREDVHPLIFIYLVRLFWEEVLVQAESFNLDELVKKEKSPGMVLGFNEDDVVQMIEEIERRYGNKYLSYSRTGGYFILNLNEKNALKALADYYTESAGILG